MKTTRIPGMDETIYIGNTYTDCLKAVVQDIFRDEDDIKNKMICSLYHVAELLVQPGKYSSAMWLETIFDTKKEYIKDSYNHYVSSYKNYCKACKKENKEPNDKVDIIKCTIDDTVLNNWYKEKINDETKCIRYSEIMTYDKRFASYRKYKITKVCAKEMDGNKDSKLIVVAVQTKFY